MVDLPSFSALTNRALHTETIRLAQGERESTAALIAALKEVDERRMYLSEGHSCLFHYCTDALGLSEPAAYKRIEIARVSRAFPQVLAAVMSGALTVSTAVVIAAHLTMENVDGLIAAASFKKKRDVERLIAERHPRPDVPTLVRKQPEQRTIPAPHAEAPSRSEFVEEAVPAAGQPVIPLASPKPAAIAPLSSSRYKIQFTADQDTHDKLRHAQALLRHQVPNGDLATIVNKALTLLIADVERRKLGFVSRPREKTRACSADSRHIPAHVRREVWRRDKGRCAFVGPSGRCRELSPLEFHHVMPFAAGGAATRDNIELRCRAHNAHEAVLYFGEEVMMAGR